MLDGDNIWLQRFRESWLKKKTDQKGRKSNFKKLIVQGWFIYRIILFHNFPLTHPYYANLIIREKAFFQSPAFSQSLFTMTSS